MPQAIRKQEEAAELSKVAQVRRGNYKLVLQTLRFLNFSASFHYVLGHIVIY